MIRRIHLALVLDIETWADEKSGGDGTEESHSLEGVDLLETEWVPETQPDMGGSSVERSLEPATSMQQAVYEAR